MLWSRVLWKGIQIRKHEKQLSDMSRFPELKDLVNVDESTYVSYAKNTLKIIPSLKKYL